MFRRNWQASFFDMFSFFPLRGAPGTCNPTLHSFGLESTFHRFLYERIIWNEQCWLFLLFSVRFLPRYHWRLQGLCVSDARAAKARHSDGGAVSFPPNGGNCFGNCFGGSALAMSCVCFGNFFHIDKQFFFPAMGGPQILWSQNSQIYLVLANYQKRKVVAFGPFALEPSSLKETGKWRSGFNAIEGECRGPSGSWKLDSWQTAAFNSAK